MYFEKDGLSWHRTWGGGLVNGGGTTQIGAPGDDEGEALGIHGRLSHIPASNVWADATWRGEAYEMWVQGKIRETTAKGENVLVERRISTRLGESRLFLHDMVTNEGLEPAPHMMLYHFNFGFPLVAEGTELIAPSIGTTHFARDGAAPIDNVHYAAPIDGFVEQGFVHEMAAGPDGFATVLLANRGFDAGRGLGLSFRYRPDELPTFMQWVFVRSGVYVTAFEPHYGTMQGRARARANGTLPFLGPGQQRQYHFEVGVLASNDEIDHLASTIVGATVGRG
jgi:hypothetical protein